ncbi:MAG: hypothetical protein LBS63_04705 [Prevotellaceae bacterium]|jgi:hypothetical protein|nr:hypothetical protein [Prevotellaceae bacterium]
MKKVLAAAVVVTAMFAAQNANGQGKATAAQQSLPPIEKAAYVDRYRAASAGKPEPDRTTLRQPKPIHLLGYLWVYPEDLGDFERHPLSAIAILNAENSHGRNTWRIPTPEELKILEANASLVGLGDYIYLATSHANGVLRLVSTGKSAGAKRAEIREKVLSVGHGVEIAGTVWARQAIATKDGDRRFKWDEATSKMPSGWRLPNENEVASLIKVFDKDAAKLASVFGIAAGGEGVSFWFKANGEYKGLTLFRDNLSSGRLSVRCQIFTNHSYIDSASIGIRCVLDE